MQMAGSGLGPGHMSPARAPAFIPGGAGGKGGEGSLSRRPRGIFPGGLGVSRDPGAGRHVPGGCDALCLVNGTSGKAAAGRGLCQTRRSLRLLPRDPAETRAPPLPGQSPVAVQPLLDALRSSGHAALVSILLRSVTPGPPTSRSFYLGPTPVLLWVSGPASCRYILLKDGAPDRIDFRLHKTCLCPQWWENVPRASLPQSWVT